MLKAARKAEKAAKKDLKNARKALKAAKRLAKQSATKAKRGSPPIIIAATLANKGKGAAMKNTAQPDQSPISKIKLAPRATAPRPLPMAVLKPAAAAPTGALRPLSKATSALPPQS